MTALEPAGTEASGKAGTSGKAGKTGEREPRTGRIHATRVALTAWLGRPLASFHLLLAICALLVVLGLVMVLSASSNLSLQQGASAYTLFGKQVVFVLVGLVLFWIGLRVPLRRVRTASPALLWGSILLLVLVLVPGLGTKVNGTRSWFTFGPIGFQPVEVAKVALALWGAHILVVKRGLMHQYRHLLVPVVPVALVMFAFAIRRMPLAASAFDSPSCSASFGIACSASSGLISTSPPR